MKVRGYEIGDIYITKCDYPEHGTVGYLYGFRGAKVAFLAAATTRHGEKPIRRPADTETRK